MNLHLSLSTLWLLLKIKKIIFGIGWRNDGVEHEMLSEATVKLKSMNMFITLPLKAMAPWMPLIKLLEKDY